MRWPQPASNAKWCPASLRRWPPPRRRNARSPGAARGRSVSLTTAMTHDTGLVAGRHADTEVFYMAGRQLGALGRRLVAAGWPLDTPALVVSRAGWPDQLASDHVLATLGQAALLHAGRPTIVTVGVGARALAEPAPASARDHGALPTAGNRRHAADTLDAGQGLAAQSPGPATVAS